MEILGIIILILVLILIIAPSSLASAYRKIIRIFCEQTTGRVIDVDVKTITGKYGTRTTSYSVHYIFTDNRGTAWRGKKEISNHRRCTFQKDDDIIVYYLKSNPNNNYISLD